LGEEAYGLIGFFTLMQIWFNILDMGLSPAFGREVSSSRASQKSFDNVNKILRSIESYFFLLSIIIISMIFIFKDRLALEWINAEQLSIESISYCLVIMAIMVGIRWFSILYKSGINGLEDQLWLNVIIVGITSIKFFGSLFVIMFISNDIELFFSYQLIIHIIELALLMYRFYSKSIKTKLNSIFFSLDYKAIKKIFPFAISIAYSTGIWIVIRQLDKLLLSNILSLKEFGYMSLVSLVSSSLTAISTPLFLAMIPRMILQNSMGNVDKVMSMYLNMSEIIVWLVGSLAAIFYLFSKEIFFILTDNIEAAIWCSEVLPWYVLGSSIIVLGSCQYYLQNIFGNLRLYVIGSTVALFLEVPLSYYITSNYGAVGAGKLWFIFSLIWFFLLTPIVHKKYIFVIRFKWFVRLFSIILSIGISSLIIFYFVQLNIDEPKIDLVVKILITSFSLFFVSSFSVSIIRNTVLSR
jgi:O-antigen/teichoic acid export membrane protein